MSSKLKYGVILVALIWLAFPLMTRGALAITAEMAKKCRALTDKAYPLRVPGNPAAGRLNGSGRDATAYFNKCVANGGNMEESTKEQK